VTDRNGGDGGDSPDDEALADAFWSVARRLRGGAREALAPWDVTPSQMRALRVLGRHGALRAGELAQHLGIAARSTTEVVDALEHRGLVRRSPDPDDRRATRVEPTERLDELMAALRRARTDEQQRLFGRLGAADRTALTRILRTLAD
jgi:DNA-binding MarR family transcriptional regulator